MAKKKKPDELRYVALVPIKVPKLPAIVVLGETLGEARRLGARVTRALRQEEPTRK